MVLVLVLVPAEVLAMSVLVLVVWGASHAVGRFASHAVLLPAEFGRNHFHPIRWQIVMTFPYRFVILY